MVHSNPLSVEQMLNLAKIAAASEPTTALEIGCGSGSLALSLARATCAQVLALDTSPDEISEAKAAASYEGLDGRLSFQVMDAKEYAGGPVDLVVCIGASHAFGTPREALRKLRTLATPSGRVLTADLVWTSSPPKDFLDFLGCEEPLYWSAEDATGEFSDAGLSIVEEIHATTESWRAFEESILASRLEKARNLPPDDGKVMEDKARQWFQIYETFGQHCFGFAAYFAKPC